MKSLFALFLFMMFANLSKAQNVVKIDDNVPQHIFSYGEIEYLEDPERVFTFDEIRKPEMSARFQKSQTYTPKYYNDKSVYWYKIRIKQTKASRRHWILEFFDQTITDITLYAPVGENNFQVYNFGNKYHFVKREYKHKNFTVDLVNNSDSVATYYVKLSSTQAANVIIVLRDIHRFIEYALDEYLIFGLFYGMIIIFSLYNLLMYFAIRKSQYLYYVLYNLGVGFYEMCSDGIAFQYIWPNQPWLNEYAVGISLFLSTIFGLLFTINFLYLRSKAPMLYKTIIGLIIAGCGFFVVCLFNTQLFSYKILEAIPLLFAYYCGFYVLKRGYGLARFYVIGYTFLLIGFTIKILLFLNVPWLPYGPVTHYSLSFCFVIEMILVSFAIGDSIRQMRKRKDYVHKRMIKQLQINDELKDTLNKELSSLVAQRTEEVVEKAHVIEKQNQELSAMNKRMIKQLQINDELKDTLNKELSSLVAQRTEEVVEKAHVIEKQNQELSAMNQLLKEQAENISRMNVLLEADNQELHVNIEKVTRARVMSQDVDFSEFSKIYPDREACFKFLSELKWANGYACKKCGNTNYLAGFLPYSRRCTKCRYDESVIANTLFQNSKIPINKSFYMLFLIYSSKGNISSHKLSEILSIRQSTCWSYGGKIKKVMEERKKELKNAGEQGWSKLVLDHHEKSEH
ncbi:7TM diverse intracellular signaling domain-containing protein [Mucilaginibacter sp. PPCGB 2223]|uniref:7TM diverse intracellular signaling domain-containing protein n=1 Tax=Mucilaginibacter sp. PPCGB 2223 TaxID=1886027 RepID=UPI00158675C0|nr:7TM diverse intracellular signaling domain-containing protein [Mucilaginibacter sp. PPCGB 2223]